MKAAKKAVKKPAAKRAVKSAAKKLPQLWKARLRGLKDDERATAVVEGDTIEQAKANAKAAFISAELAEKPAIAWCTPLPEGAYRVYNKSSDGYMLVTDVAWQYDPKGKPRGDAGDEYRRVGYVKAAFHAAHLKDDHYQKWGTVIMCVERRGLIAEHIDEGPYVEPSKLFRAEVGWFWPKIRAIFTTEAKKRGVKMTYK